MKMTLEQLPKEKTRAEWAAETIEERMAIADMAARIFASAITKEDRLPEILDSRKSQLMAHAIQAAFTIAKGVALEDVRRHGARIDSV